MKVHLQLEIVDLAYRESNAFWTKEVDWPALPSAEAQVQLTDGGWSETVNRVWFFADTPERPPSVDLRSNLYSDGSGADTPAEMWASLRESGWTAPYPPPWGETS